MVVNKIHLWALRYSKAPYIHDIQNGSRVLIGIVSREKASPLQVSSNYNHLYLNEAQNRNSNFGFPQTLKTVIHSNSLFVSPFQG